MARSCDDCRRDHVIIPNAIAAARVHTWSRNEPGDELFTSAAPIAAWRVPTLDPDEPVRPIPVGMPLDHRFQAWAVALDGRFYFADVGVEDGFDRAGAAAAALRIVERQEARQKAEQELRARQGPAAAGICRQEPRFPSAGKPKLSQPELEFAGA